MTRSRFDMPPAHVLQARQKLVLDHFHDEVAQEWDDVLSTFPHRGPLGGIPPMGGAFRVRMTAYFIFDEDENLVCERVYFDSLTMLKQLLGGLNLKNPRSLLKLVRALRGLAAMTANPDQRLLTTTPPPDLPV
jgi:hypothetical protein